MTIEEALGMAVDIINTNPKVHVKYKEERSRPGLTWPRSDYEFLLIYTIKSSPDSDSYNDIGWWYGRLKRSTKGE